MLTREEQGAIIKRIGELEIVATQKRRIYCEGEEPIQKTLALVDRAMIIELLLAWPTMPEAPGAKPGPSDVKCFDCGAQAHFIIHGKACCYEHYSLHGRARNGD